MLRLISFIFAMLFALQVYAQTEEVILTTVPGPKEVVVTPEGYTNCFVVKAGWHNGQWIPDHQICEYSTAPEGVAWVESYWACTKTKGTECVNWEWKPGRWVKALAVY